MKVALYTLCDDNYVVLVRTMIYSFLYNNSWFDGDIVILYCADGVCELSEGSRSWLSELSPKVKFEAVITKGYEKLFENARNNGVDDWLFLSFCKLDIFKKNEYNRKVYIDGDAIVNGNIRGLFYNNEDNVLVVEDGAKPFSNYFNAGVMSIPMWAISDDFYEKSIKFGETFTKDSFKNKCSNLGQSFDQDISNELLTNVRFIDKEYNISPYYEDISTEKLSEVKIVHYYGHYKPWLGHCEFKPSYYLFYRYYFQMEHNFELKK